jgi:hypothetical protein
MAAIRMNQIRMNWRTASRACTLFMRKLEPQSGDQHISSIPFVRCDFPYTFLGVAKNGYCTVLPLFKHHSLLSL